MPAHQPFTALCQALARPRAYGRADLHVHTTCSDGVYTPAQIVDLTRRSGLAAVAITDHDTLAGIAPARQAAGTAVEVIAGVEITTEFRGDELHLLGYFVGLDDGPLPQGLVRLQHRRTERFREMCQRLSRMGIDLDADAMSAIAQRPAPGRRHVAELLVKSGRAANVREAFQRWLGDRGRVIVPKATLPVAEAIALVRKAGGVAAWAHPPYDASKEVLQSLHFLGMQAVEVDYPRCRPGFGRRLRDWARQLGLAVTGGSDCHGPDAPARGLGCCGVSRDELKLLRGMSS